METQSVEEIYSILSSCVSNKNKGFLVNLKYEDFVKFCKGNTSGYKLNDNGRSLY